jgi:hypothetical protein
MFGRLSDDALCWSVMREKSSGALKNFWQAHGGVWNFTPTPALRGATAQRHLYHRPPAAAIKTPMHWTSTQLHGPSDSPP